MNNTWLNHPIVQTTLTTAGWYAGRTVDIGKWDSILSAEGYFLFPAATSVLTEYGDLTLIPPYLEDALVNISEIRIDPIWGGSGEADRILGWGEEISKSLYPIGMVDSEIWLMIAEDGAVYGDLLNELILYGASFEETLNILILRKRRWTNVPIVSREFLTPESLYRETHDQS